MAPVVLASGSAEEALDGFETNVVKLMVDLPQLPEERTEEEFQQRTLLRTRRARRSVQACSSQTEPTTNALEETAADTAADSHPRDAAYISDTLSMLHVAGLRAKAEQQAEIVHKRSADRASEMAAARHNATRLRECLLEAETTSPMGKPRLRKTDDVLERALCVLSPAQSAMQESSPNPVGAKLQFDFDDVAYPTPTKMRRLRSKQPSPQSCVPRVGGGPPKPSSSFPSPSSKLVSSASKNDLATPSPKKSRLASSHAAR